MIDNELEKYEKLMEGAIERLEIIAKAFDSTFEKIEKNKKEILLENALSCGVCNAKPVLVANFGKFAIKCTTCESSTGYYKDINTTLSSWSVINKEL